ncbi:hypothetical protein WJX79_010536 [Trebouxia sp. C0005]
MVCSDIQCLRSPSTSHALPAIPAVASHSGFARRVRLTRRCRGYEELGSSHAGATGSHSKRASLHICASQSRPLSFKQRWRSFKTAADEQTAKAKDAIGSLPPVQALANAVHMADQKLGPLYNLLKAIGKWWDAQVERYAEFGGEEVKRQWEWKRRTEAERSLWVSIGQFLGMSLLTAFWEAITPVSIFWGAILPLFLAWILYDRPFFSPIVVTLILMTPFKFPPGYNVRLI